MDGAYGLCKRRKKKKLIKTNYNIVFFQGLYKCYFWFTNQK